MVQSRTLQRLLQAPLSFEFTLHAGGDTHWQVVACDLAAVIGWLHKPTRSTINRGRGTGTAPTQLRGSSTFALP